MAYRSFRHFLETLEQAGELTRVSDPVDTDLLITEWADREMKSSGGGKALLFEQPVVDGQVSKFPVAINTMGSRKRIAMALGRESIDEIAQEIQLILKAKPPTDLREGFALLKQGIHLLHARPKQVRDAPCQEIIHKIESDAGRADDFSLRHLPILKCWPKDGGRFITLPNVHTRDPETGARNVGVYRMQIFDERTTAMHWQVHKVGARHGKRYYERNEPMPVAVALGGDPALSFSATAPLPDGLDEVLFAGFLRRKSIEMVKCKTIDLEVPAGVDLPVFKMNFPELVDMTLPAEGVFHNLVIVSIRKQYPYQAFKVMHGLWGMGQMMFSKYIVVVDEDCDVHNTSEVLFRLCANTDPGRDTTVIKNPSDSLDHAPTEQNIGSHMGFDATRKLPGENYHRQWPELLKMTDEAKALVDALQKKTR